ncbi:MAG: bla [Bryobacterales bacterium]|nr:bla [Bryobacterales bacterium]
MGETTLTAVLTPAHTKGCTTWTMPVAENGKTYHVVFYCSTSVPGYHLIHNKYYPEMVSDDERSFATIQKLPCDVFLANHTEFFHMTESWLGKDRARRMRLSIPLKSNRSRIAVPKPVVLFAFWRNFPSTSSEYVDGSDQATETRRLAEI